MENLDSIALTAKQQAETMLALRRDVCMHTEDIRVQTSNALELLVGSIDHSHPEQVAIEELVLGQLDAVLEATHKIARGVRILRTWYARRQQQRQLLNDLIAHLQDLPEGSLSTAGELFEHVDKLLREWIEHDIERAESAAGWDPNP